jgi:predicted small secreted protein
MSVKLTRPLLLSAALAFLAAPSLTGCNTFGGNKKAERAAAAVQSPNMGVNSYLWRASLETLNFMPLEQVDPFGGVIVTDWYASAEAPNERFKANVYILDTALRADALKASIFKQTRDAGGWNDAAVDADTARQIENAILTRARELYIATVDSQ